MGDEEDDGTDEDRDALAGHAKGEDCIKLAEEVEREHGLFDNHELDAETRKTIASKMKEHAITLFGKVHDDFVEKFHAAMTKEDNAMGAPGACRFLFKHHDEL